MIKLLELLNKRKNNEELTDEEKAILAEYDESIAVHMSEIDKLRAEKESYEVKFGNANTELQEKLKTLTEKDEALKKEMEEKENIKKILENTTSTHEARLEMARQKAEKEKLDEIAKQKALAEAKREKEEEDKKETQKRLKELEEKLAMNDFEKTILAEKIKKPYLEKQLSKILLELQVKGLEKSKIALEILNDVYNHDEEMAKWEASKQKSTDIFTPKETKVVDNTKSKKVDSEKEKEKILEFAKKNGFRIFNKNN